MTEQLAVVPVCESEHSVALNVPGPLLVQFTVPIGADGVPVALSATIAVHVVGCPIWTEVGEHLTVVEVVRGLTVKVVFPELPA